MRSKFQNPLLSQIIFSHDSWKMLFMRYLFQFKQKALLRHLFRQRFFRFCLVGASGFLVDGAVFLVLIQVLNFDMIGARMVAFWVAASWNWYCNRRFTFMKTGRTRLRKSIEQWLNYMGASGVGFIFNMGSFLLLKSFTPLYQWPLLMLALSVLVGLLCNYLLASRIVFKS